MRVFRHLGLLMKGVMLRGVPGMITCREFEAFILDYLDGVLPQRQRRIFDWHLNICAECREYLAAYQRSIELGRAVFDQPEDGVPDDVPEDLIRAVVKARRQR